MFSRHLEPDPEMPSCKRERFDRRALWMVVVVVQLSVVGCLAGRRFEYPTGRRALTASPMKTGDAKTAPQAKGRDAKAARSCDVRLVEQDESDDFEIEAPVASSQLLGTSSIASRVMDLDEDQAFGDVPPTFTENARFGVVSDLQLMPRRVKDDVGALLTWENGLFLGTAAAGAAVVRNNVDQRVAQDTAEHGPLGGRFSAVFSHGGDAFLVHVPLLATMYVTSVCKQDEDLHDLTLTMLTSYKFSVLSALVLQYATGTHRSGNSAFSLIQDNGFPSEPTAASFALAAVVDEKYGWKGGVPAYLTAGVIAWSEVDQSHHKVSEVVFGAALGYAIGKSIGALHYGPDKPLKLVPFVDPNSGAQGLAFEMRY
jgi:hypothetical protein